MAKRNVSKLTSFFDPSSFMVELNSIEDVMNCHVTMKGVEWRKGPNGDYAVIDLTNNDTGADMKVSCGGMVVVAALKAAEAQRAFPFDCRVGKNGRMIILMDAE